MPRGVPKAITSGHWSSLPWRHQSSQRQQCSANGGKWKTHGPVGHCAGNRGCWCGLWEPQIGHDEDWTQHRVCVSSAFVEKTRSPHVVQAGVGMAPEISTGPG